MDPQARGRIQGAIAMLAHDPPPPGARALRGSPGMRVLVGDYGVIYTVEDDVLLVVVVALGHRREVYARLSEGQRCLTPHDRRASSGGSG